MNPVVWRQTSLCAFLALSFALAGCGDPIEHHVQEVMAGGEGREEAMMELLFVKTKALPAILQVLGDTTQSARGRADLVEILWQIYIREADARIAPALMGLIDDPAPQVRRAVPLALASMGKKESVHPLLKQLAIEQDEDIKLQLLIALELLDEWDVEHVRTSTYGTNRFTITGGEELTSEERKQFTDLVISMYKTASTDTLRGLAEEMFEKVVGQIVEEADQRIIKADLAGAEALYQQALALKPDSKNAGMRYGKFLFFEGDRQQGLKMLEEHGMVLHVPRLRQAPTIDGDLSDPVWTQAAKIDHFYQSLPRMRVIAAEGRAEVYLGYTEDRIYAACKVYEDSRILVATHTVRDTRIDHDDSVAFGFDTDLDLRTYYNVRANSIGTITDSYSSNVPGESSPAAWNGVHKVANQVEADYWTIEMEVPLDSLGNARVKKGDIWGCNISPARVGLGTAPDLWVPTYGRFSRPHRFGLLVFD
jgi:hypothetical protein